MVYFIMYFSAAVAFAAYLLPLVIWWPYRRTGMLRSVPWIVGMMIFSAFLSPLGAGFAERLNNLAPASRAAEGASMILMYLSVSLICWSGVLKFLFTLMICANGVYLLSRVESLNKPLRKVAWVYEHTTTVGVLMVVAAVIPKLHSWWALVQLKAW